MVVGSNSDGPSTSFVSLGGQIDNPPAQSTFPSQPDSFPPPVDSEASSSTHLSLSPPDRNQLSLSSSNLPPGYPFLPFPPPFPTSSTHIASSLVDRPSSTSSLSSNHSLSYLSTEGETLPTSPSRSPEEEGGSKDGEEHEEVDDDQFLLSLL